MGDTVISWPARNFTCVDCGANIKTTGRNVKRCEACRGPYAIKWKIAYDKRISDRKKSVMITRGK